ncbi:hypothetical protein [uncultured Shewanella sp.]|uniref:hypothetical protein n=1 Tax=uncultured Shewanella sp. TaxID=173975 RepID=UPI002630A4A3|nr:hypothetical protein [uncultured Shewanella sp.]
MFQLSLTERQKEIGIMLLALIHSNIGIDIHRPSRPIKFKAKKNQLKELARHVSSVPKGNRLAR